ncbi:MAG TPA: two-component system response regulator [Hyphomonadaceae bacterium]|nr:two-component system response regulator [Hyphomonadaceae bacterium]
MSVSILLAEDHEPNRKVLRRRLERRGFTVFEAADGVEAVAMFQQQPDIVLLDLSMPNMSGMEALQQIRAMAGGKDTPVVALTAHAMNEMRVDCEAAGFDDFVTKPIEFDNLLLTIQRLAPAAA